MFTGACVASRVTVRGQHCRIGFSPPSSYVGSGSQTLVVRVVDKHRCSLSCVIGPGIVSELVLTAMLLSQGLPCFCYYTVFSRTTNCYSSVSDSKVWILQMDTTHLAFTWVQETKLKSQGLHGSAFDLVTHLCSPVPCMSSPSLAWSSPSWQGPPAS